MQKRSIYGYHRSQKVIAFPICRLEKISHRFSEIAACLHGRSWLYWSMLFDSVVFEDRLHGIKVMSYPFTEVICGKCGTTLSKVINLRPVRDILRTHDSKCKVCGNSLNPSDFTIEVEKL
jgi:hypothetical protein